MYLLVVQFSDLGPVVVEEVEVAVDVKLATSVQLFGMGREVVVPSVPSQCLLLEGRISLPLFAYHYVVDLVGILPLGSV